LDRRSDPTLSGLFWAGFPFCLSSFFSFFLVSDGVTQKLHRYKILGRSLRLIVSGCMLDMAGLVNFAGYVT
jgi:hypothetical protein